ncbi:hypothetical protein LJB76_01500 [Clostridia bacterium OttesenSCG-928-O13]|nr:hypothetical protein [Clostridia bacterium OttesenSCG-928-O13]
MGARLVGLREEAGRRGEGDERLDAAGDCAGMPVDVGVAAEATDGGEREGLP